MRHTGTPRPTGAGRDLERKRPLARARARQRTPPAFRSAAALLWLVACLAAGASGAAAAAPSSRAVSAQVEPLVERAARQRLAEHPMWWRLLRYRRGLLGVTSEVDGGPFFNAPGGRTDPEAELAATLRALFAAGPGDEGVQHPYCRFPARLAWLASELHLDLESLPRQPCPRFEDFRRRVDAESISLIFSSYYLNNPASAFGHTLLRLNQRRAKGDEERRALLDHGINFGATVDTQNALLYAIKGLLGFFPGEFTNVPYYLKVREYNDYESRDLWELELALSPREVEMAVAHIWELGSARFAYYYLTENCSYHMLGILEVASPRLSLVSRLGWPVLPADTLEAVAEQPGLVRSITYRPSLRAQFRARLAQLTAPESALVLELGRDPGAALPATLSVERQMAVLDAALDFAEFRYSEQLLDPGSEPARLEQRLLRRRARLGRPSPTLELEPPRLENPLAAHRRARLDLGEGYSQQAGFYQALDLRLALHDWSDPAAGYPETLSINFLPLRLRHLIERRRLELEELSLVSITSLAPIDRFDRSMSWNARLGADRIHDAGCDHCFTGVAELGGGVAAGLAGNAVLGFLNANTELRALGPIEGGLFGLPLRAGVGPKAGLRLRPAPDLVAVLSGDLSYLPAQSPSVTWAVSATLRWMYRLNFALSLEARARPEQRSVQAASSLYF